MTMLTLHHTNIKSLNNLSDSEQCSGQKIFPAMLKMHVQYIYVCDHAMCSLVNAGIICSTLRTFSLPLYTMSTSVIIEITITLC